MDANTSIAGSQLMAAREIGEWKLVQVDLTKHFSIGRPKCRQHLFDAAAHKFVDDGFRCDRLRRVRAKTEFYGPFVHCRAFRRVAAIVVDDCIAQNTEEPRRHRLLFAQRAGMFDGTHVSSLHNVFCKRAIANAPLYKGEEGGTAFEQRLQRRFRHLELRAS